MSDSNFTDLKKKKKERKKKKKNQVSCFHTKKKKGNLKVQQTRFKKQMKQKSDNDRFDRRGASFNIDTSDWLMPGGVSRTKIRDACFQSVQRIRWNWARYYWTRSSGPPPDGKAEVLRSGAVRSRLRAPKQRNWRA